MKRQGTILSNKFFKTDKKNKKLHLDIFFYFFITFEILISILSIITMYLIRIVYTSIQIVTIVGYNIMVISCCLFVLIYVIKFKNKKNKKLQLICFTMLLIKINMDFSFFFYMTVNENLFIILINPLVSFLNVLLIYYLKKNYFKTILEKHLIIYILIGIFVFSLIVSIIITQDGKEDSEYKIYIFESEKIIFHLIIYVLNELSNFFNDKLLKFKTNFKIYKKFSEYLSDNIYKSQSLGIIMINDDVILKNEFIDSLERLIPKTRISNFLKEFQKTADNFPVNNSKDNDQVKEYNNKIHNLIQTELQRIDEAESEDNSTVKVNTLRFDGKNLGDTKNSRPRMSLFRNSTLPKMKENDTSSQNLINQIHKKSTIIRSETESECCIEFVAKYFFLRSTNTSLYNQYSDYDYKRIISVFKSNPEINLNLFFNKFLNSNYYYQDIGPFELLIKSGDNFTDTGSRINISVMSHNKHTIFIINNDKNISSISSSVSVSDSDNKEKIIFEVNESKDSDKSVSPYNEKTHNKVQKNGMDNPTWRKKLSLNNLNTYSDNISSKIRRGSDISYSKCLSAVNDKLSALLHDFKNVVHDNNIFFEYIVNDVLSDNKVDNQKISDYKSYLDIIKNYTISLVLNITNFLSNNSFLVGDYSPVDLLNILRIMKNIFERRIEYDNSNIKNNTDNMNIKQINKKSIIIKLNILSENGHFKKILTNQNLLISLLYNILSNSYKYTDKGEITIDLSVDENLESFKRMILIRISDTGKGIPDKILNSWGKPFGFKDKSKGTGLGQFIITTIANNLGFYIPKPQSIVGQGTIIKIYIPIDNEELKSSRSFVPVNTIKKDSIFKIEDSFKNFKKSESVIDKKYHIMCLDDDGIILNSLRNIISKSLNKNFQFELILVDNVTKFFSELFNLLNNNTLIDIFILDQNINNTLTGLDCADIVLKLYNNYSLIGNDYIRFYFVTEDTVNIKHLIDGYYNGKFKKENVFTKSQFKELCLSINSFILK